MQKFSKIVLTHHLFIPRKEVEDVERFKWELTAKSRYNEGEFPMYVERAGWFGVPIHHFRDPSLIADRVEDARIVTKSIKMKMRSTMLPFQQEIIDDFQKRVMKGATGFLLEAPPGSGKTVMLLKMISVLDMRALVIVPRSNLVKQWVARIREHTSFTNDEIGIVTDGKALWEGKKIVVGLVHSVALDRYGDDFRRYFGIAAFDEVDRSVPPATFAPVVGLFPVKYRLGATATMKRQDGLSVIFNKHIGEVILHGKATNRMKPRVLMVPFAASSGFVPPRLSKLQRRGILLKRISENALRNSMIVDYVILMLNSDRRCLVLSDRIEQLSVIRMAVARKMRGKIEPEELGLYVRDVPTGGRTTGGKSKKKKLTSEEQAWMEKNCKVIFATYGMFALGTDVKELSGLIYATPQSETEQSRGRIERALEGKKEPIVVDILDSFYPDTVRWADNRMRQYRSKGIEIKFVGEKK